MGIGKLYRLSDSQFLAYVNYKLFHHEAATNWWGELITVDYVPLDEGERFIIELEDKRIYSRNKRSLPQVYVLDKCVWVFHTV